MRRYLDLLDRLLDALSYQRRGSSNTTISPSHGLAERYVRALAREPIDPPDEYGVRPRGGASPAGNQARDLLIEPASRDVGGDPGAEQAATTGGPRVDVGPAAPRGEGAVRGTGEPARELAGAAVRPGTKYGADDLSEVGIFGDLEPEVRQRVIAAAVPRSYRKGQLLFVEDDPGDSLIVLKRGAVALFRTAPTGERTVLAAIRPPDVLGEVSLLDGSARSLSAEAIEDCSALALSRGAFIELGHSNPAILDAVMRSLGALIRRLTEQNVDHVFLDPPGRVAKMLVRLVGDSYASTISIELDRSQLAEMAGGSRQSVNQAIASFASRGWLRTEGRRIVITDVAALRHRAGMADRTSESTLGR